MGLVAWPIIRSEAVLNVDVVCVGGMSPFLSSASIRENGARVHPRTTSRDRSRVPKAPGSSHDALKPQCTRKLFYSRRAPYTQTPLPDRATSQHPSNIHKAKHQNASSRAQQSSRIPNSTNLAKSNSATVSKILVLRAPTTRHLGAPVPRPGTRICRHPLPRSGPPFEGLLRCREGKHRSRNLVLMSSC